VRVAAAADGQQALDLLARDSDFDGILMDCQMPVMDGYETTRALRRMPAFEKMPILAMTANAMLGDRDKVIEAGMNDHIAKPIDLAQLCDTLTRWIVPRNPALAVPAALPLPPTGNAATAEAAPEEALPSTLAGIDMEAGLRVSVGNLRLYRQMLIRFRDANGDFGGAFARALGGADATAAARAAHTLKGTAGNIGARALYSAAEELERACEVRASPQEMQPLLQRVLATLVIVVEGLRGLTLAAPAPAAPTLDHTALQALIDKLDAHLADSSVDAVEQMNALAAQPLPAAVSDQLDVMRRLVEGYDFEEARALLGSVKRLLNESAPTTTA